MMVRISLLALTLVIGAAGSAIAQSPGEGEDSIIQLRDFEIYASDDAAQLSLIAGSSAIEAESGQVRFGFLFGEERDNVFNASVAVDARPQLVPDITLSLVARAYAGLLAQENTDVFGLAAGLEGAYDYPTERFPLHLSAGVYYAPDIFTFGQSDRIIDYHVRAGVRLGHSLTGFVGFRFLQFDTRPGDREIDDQLHVGVRWQSG